MPCLWWIHVAFSLTEIYQCKPLAYRAGGVRSLTQPHRYAINTPYVTDLNATVPVSFPDHICLDSLSLTQNWAKLPYIIKLTSRAPGTQPRASFWLALMHTRAGWVSQFVEVPINTPGVWLPWLHYRPLESRVVMSVFPIWPWILLQRFHTVNLFIFSSFANTCVYDCGNSKHTEHISKNFQQVVPTVIYTLNF